MENRKVAQRYAKALFSLAQERKQVDLIHADLEVLQKIIPLSSDFNEFLHTPFISMEQQREILKMLFKRQAHSLTMLFLGFLTERKKLKYLQSICHEFIKFHSEHGGILKAKVVSVVPMRPDQIEVICRKLKEHFQKNIQPRNEVDPDLLGGFKVQVEDLIYDFSIRTQLNRFGQEVLSA